PGEGGASLIAAGGESSNDSIRYPHRHNHQATAGVLLMVLSILRLGDREKLLEWNNGNVDRLAGRSHPAQKTLPQGNRRCLERPLDADQYFGPNMVAGGQVQHPRFVIDQVDGARVPNLLSNLLADSL